MGQQNAARGSRRVFSSLPSICALAALVGLLLARAPITQGQDLRLQPAIVNAEAIDSDQSDSTLPETAPDLAANTEPANPPAATVPNDPQPTPGPPENAVLPAPIAEERSTPSARRSDAPPRTPIDLRVVLERRGNLNLHDVELRAALFMISEQWGINVVAGDVKGSVNGVFREAPLREILDSILLSNGYNYRAVGESIVISSIAELGQINPFFQSATIPVRAADIDEVVQGAQLLTTPQGQVQAIKSARSIVVLDFPDRVKMIREFVTTIDRATQLGLGGAGQASQPLEVGYFRTQHISAKTAEDVLQPVLSKEGRVAIMEKEDRLLISDYAENLAMVQHVLERVDRPRPQVRITALIYDISLEDLEQMGINWSQFGYRTSQTAIGLGIGTQQVQGNVGDGVVDASITDGVNLAFGALSRHFDIAAVAIALQGAKDTRLLADPSVAVLENEEAVFKSVQEIPIQQLTQTGQGGQIGTTAFREAGVKLTVTPKIAADGTIRMHVSPEFSRRNGVDLQGQPIIDTRVTETVLSAANGQTIVIAGLRQREDIGDFSGVPYLKDMRGVGKLFRSRDTRVRESELVVFICAEIISSADPLNHREAAVADTVGCRLNQIPEGEGCPPPCECDPSMPPLRLPEPDVDYAELLPPMAARSGWPTPASPAVRAAAPAINPSPAWSPAGPTCHVGGAPQAVPTIVQTQSLPATPSRVPPPSTGRDSGQFARQNSTRRLPTVEPVAVATTLPPPTSPPASPLFGAPPAAAHFSPPPSRSPGYREPAPPFAPPRIGGRPAGDSTRRR